MPIQFQRQLRKPVLRVNITIEKFLFQVKKILFSLLKKKSNDLFFFYISFVNSPILIFCI